MVFILKLFIHYTSHVVSSRDWAWSVPVLRLLREISGWPLRTYHNFHDSMRSLYFVTSQRLNFGLIWIILCIISSVIGDVKRRFKYGSWTFLAVHLNTIRLEITSNLYNIFTLSYSCWVLNVFRIGLIRFVSLSFSISIILVYY